MDLELDEPKPKNNTLSIRLTESAVFLTTDGHSRIRDRNVEQRSTLLRGLLILQLVKPTRITSIEVELTATTSTAWPEGDNSFILCTAIILFVNLGIGARRIEVTEEHRVFHASTVYFRAIKSHAGRSVSVGPGISYDNIDNDDDWDVSFHTTASPSNNNNETNTLSQPVPRMCSSFGPRMNRRVSVDSSHVRRMSLDDQSPTRRDIQQLPPVPPYSPFALPVTSDTSFPTAHGVNANFVPSMSNHLRSFEDPRHSHQRGSYHSQYILSTKH